MALVLASALIYPRRQRARGNALAWPIARRSAARGRAGKSRETSQAGLLARRRGASSEVSHERLARQDRPGNQPRRIRKAPALRGRRAERGRRPAGRADAAGQHRSAGTTASASAAAAGRLGRRAPKAAAVSCRPPRRSRRSMSDRRRVRAWNDSAGRGCARWPRPVSTRPSGQSDAGEGLDLSREERAALLEAAMRGASGNTPLALVAIQDRRLLRRSAWPLLGGAAALKHGVGRVCPRAPPFIAAAEGPSKIQPPSDATVQSGGDTAALLMKDSATSAPVKVVSTEEQPVDLRAQTPSPDPTPCRFGCGGIASFASGAGSPVAPPRYADRPPAVDRDHRAAFPRGQAGQDRFRAAGRNADIGRFDAGRRRRRRRPRRRRRSTNSHGATGSRPRPASPLRRKLDLPTKLSPKSSARVVAKTDTTAPADATDTTPTAPLQLGAPVRRAKPPRRRPPRLPRSSPPTPRRTRRPPT